MPLLLQLFVWYVGVLATMPMPQQALELGPAHVDVRGVHLPRFVLHGEAGWILVIALVCGIAWAAVLARWARRRQIATGQTFPVAAAGLAAIAGVPLLALLLLGIPDRPRLPNARPLQLRGRAHDRARVHGPAAGLIDLYRELHRRDRALGYQAVPKGQKEAALAIGLSRGQTLRFVVIPQAMRVIIPPLTSQFLNLTKNSSLAVAIGYPDLVSVWSGTVLNQTGQAVEVILVTMCVYLTISLVVSAHELVQRVHGAGGAVGHGRTAPTSSPTHLAIGLGLSAPICSRRGAIRR